MALNVKVVAVKNSDFYELKELMERVRDDGVFSAIQEIRYFQDLSSSMVEIGQVGPSCFFLFLDGLGLHHENVRKIRLNRNYLFAPVIVIGIDDCPEVVASYIRYGAQDYLLRQHLTYEVLCSALNKVQERIKIWDRFITHQHRKADNIAIVSHDLKTPLSIIKTYMEIILNDEEVELPKMVREKLERSRYNANLALDLVSNILDEYRAKKNWRFNYGEFGLNKLIEDVVQNLSMRVERKKLTVKMNIAESFLIYADKKSIMQLFTNILDNSIKYSPDGGTIEVKLRHYQSELSANVGEKEFVNIVISDEGPGIPKEHLKAIFDPYKQVSSDDRKTGHGLGLSICRRICDFHMGRIWAVGKIPHGLSIQVLLPIFRKQISTQSPSFSSHVGIHAPTGMGKLLIDKPRCVLVVDDLKDIRDITGAQMKMLGITVFLARDVPSAISIIETEKLDLILLDLNMPRQNGEELLKQVKQSFNWCKIPVFIYSFFKTNSIFANSLQLAEGFVQKPLIIDEFVAKTKLLLGWTYVISPSGDGDGSIENTVGMSTSGTDQAAKKIRALLVDDSEDNHEILKFYWHQTANELSGVMSGQECLELLNRRKREFDIVLMDISMPEMDGHETVRHIRMFEEKHNLRPLPIVAFSVEEVDMDESIALQNGFSGFIPKPIDMAKLQQLITRLCPP